MAEKVSSVSKEQIKVFKSLKLLQTHVERLGLRRIFVQDMPSLTDLDGVYIGGKIVSVLSESYSQGHDAIVFVEDGDMGVEALHGMIQISGDLIELLPTLDDGFKLFVSGAHLEDDGVEFSQDTGKKLNNLWYPFILVTVAIR